MKEAEELFEEDDSYGEEIKLPLFSSEEEQEIEEAINEYEEKRERARQHPVTQTAEKYGDEVYDWFQKKKDLIVRHHDPETGVFHVTSPGIEDIKTLEKLTDSVDVIMWYHFQMPIKLKRAFTSLYEEQEEPEFFEGLTKDSDGSAHVALMGINRSLTTWIILLRMLPSETDFIKTMIRILMWLKIEVEKEFPGALHFQWPPEYDQ